MKNEVNKSNLYSILVFGFCIVLFFMYITPSNEKNKKITENIENIYRTEISGIVSSAHPSRGMTTLRLRGRVDYPYYLPSSRNYNLSPPELYSFVQREDSVYKAPNSNEFYIFRNGHRYRFVLNEYINLD